MERRASLYRAQSMHSILAAIYKPDMRKVKKKKKKLIILAEIPVYALDSYLVILTISPISSRILMLYSVCKVITILAGHPTTITILSFF